VATSSNQYQGKSNSLSYGIKGSLPHDPEQAIVGGLKVGSGGGLDGCVIATYVVCVVASFS
jgi:hypothetical protein